MRFLLEFQVLLHSVTVSFFTQCPYAGGVEERVPLPSAGASSEEHREREREREREGERERARERAVAVVKEKRNTSSADQAASPEDASVS